MYFSRQRFVALAIFVAAFAGTTMAQDTADSGSIRGEQLRPVSRGTATLFTRLDSQQTGVDFQIDIDTDHERRRLYEIAFAGAGIAVADYDNDGRPDVFMTHHTDADRLYRQVGDFQFVDVTGDAGLGEEIEWSSGATFVDINNDGLIDLYVCHYDSHNSLYMNNGDGTFTEKAAEFGLDFRGASVMAAFADYDRDGDLDLYLLTSRLAANAAMERQVRTVQEEGPGGRMRTGVESSYLEYTDFIDRPNGQSVQIATGQRDVLFRNDNGHFEAVEFVRAGTGKDDDKDNHMGMGVVWWDYDGDQWPDIYVANDLFGPDRLYRNNGDGTFTDVVDTALPHTPWFSMGVDFGDINNDGRFDLMTADMSATSHYEEKVGMGDMASQGWFLTSAEPRQYMRNALHLNSGTDRFLESAFLAGVASTDWTWSVKLNDFDNDGFNDLFITNGMVRNFMDADTQREIQAATDLDDYWDILKTRAVKKDTNLAFRNNGDLGFENASSQWGLDHTGLSFGAAVSDLDRDGDLDLIVNNLDEPVTIYRNDSDSGGRVLVRLEGLTSNRNGIGAVVRIETESGVQVRQLSPTRGFMSADEPLLQFGTGSAMSLLRLTVSWPSGKTQAFENLPVNHLYSIREGGVEVAAMKPLAKLYRDETSALNLKHEHRELEFDDYAQQPLLPAKLSQLGPGMAWGDVDGDGDDDVYIGGAAGDPGALYLAVEGGGFEYQENGPWEEHEHREDLGALWLDVESDGDLDLVVASGGVEAGLGDIDMGDRLYLNNGDGEFRTAPQPSLPEGGNSSSVVIAADIDSDGDLDLFIGGRTIPGEYPKSPDSRLLINQEGQFIDMTEELAPGLRQAGMVTGALWSDADDDSDPDLMLTIEWGPVRYFENDSGQFTERTREAGLATHQGWWNGIASVDIDNDGDSDYVVTNVGLNTKYRASHDEPAVLYYGDFAGTGRSNLVEAHWEDETEFPIRGLSCSSGAMPFIADEFGTFDEFARADVEQLLSPVKMQSAERFTATELRHGILINDGDAHFDFRPLPMLAQIAPAFGAVSGDFNLDGNADVYIVQNSYAPQPETGRMDGGLSLLLLGDGQGGLKSMWPDASGLVVPGDAKSLAVTDYDGDGRADILIARNDDSLLAFRNMLSNTEFRPLSIRLQGLPGNKEAIGARIRVLHASGKTQVTEVHAGSGYLSQSIPAAFLANPAGDPVAEIQITWPDGKTSRYTPGGDESQVLAVHPAIEP